jgi:hypothetical protein
MMRAAPAAKLVRSAGTLFWKGDVTCFAML